MFYRQISRHIISTTINKIFVTKYQSRCICSSIGFPCSARSLLNSRANVLPSLVFYRCYNRQERNASAGILRKRLWRVIRGVFLFTGGLVWAVAFIAYFSLEKVNVDVQGEGLAGLGGLERRLVNRFYNEKDEAGILRKDEALERVWRKLSKEERLKEVFGSPVYMCGYNYNNNLKGEQLQGRDLDNTTLSDQDKTLNNDDFIKEREIQGESENDHDETSIDNLWEAGCYIEGPKNLGLLKVVFEEYKQEWVPIALHLETLEKSGQVITDVSGSVPNGLKNFTRLTN